MGQKTHTECPECGFTPPPLEHNAPIETINVEELTAEEVVVEFQCVRANCRTRWSAVYSFVGNKHEQHT